MKRVWRIVALVAAVVAVLTILGWIGLRTAIGTPKHQPEEGVAALSPAARELVANALSDFQRDPAFDYHVHLAGIGTGGSGCRVNPRMRSWWDPKLRIQFLSYLQAGGVEDEGSADAQYVDRLWRLAHGVGCSRYVLFAFDANYYSSDGSENFDHTDMFIPLDYAVGVAHTHPETFVAVGSVHPYRPDAVAELERAARAGVHMIKWLPNAMGIDPNDARCDAFYAAMARLNLVLLSHGGDEQAVKVPGAQELGNPMRLRRALEHGVTVIVAHCAPNGQGIDLDDKDGRLVDNFDLFLRMMDDPRWVGKLYGEISTLTQCNHCGRPLSTMLARTDLHERLVNGSDYPLPAIDVLYRTGQLRDLGYLTADEARLVSELWDLNPLLFDLVLKRTVKHPTSGAKFPASVFRDRLKIGR